LMESLSASILKLTYGKSFLPEESYPLAESS
jgi:hypothetical protein